MPAPCASSGSTPCVRPRKSSAESAFYLNPELSPDGKHAALEKITETSRDIWLLELARGIFTRFTSDANGTLPLWSPNGNQIFFAETNDFSLKPVNGAGKEEHIFQRTGDFLPDDWTRDGKTIVFERGNIQDLWIMPLSGAKELVEAAGHESKLVVFEKAKHVQTYKSDPQLYMTNVLSFLQDELTK